MTGVRPTTPPNVNYCYTGYCDFVRCVRRINSNRLINQCVITNLANKDLNIESQRLSFYVNTTSCILARARCNSYNPITGELQNGQRQIRADQLANSLQISSGGDIRVITFPARTVVADLFCSSRATLDQTTFGDSMC